MGVGQTGNQLFFPATGRDQAIQRVVGIFVFPRYFLIVKELNRNGVVDNFGDIARRVVGIVQILQYLATGFGGEQLD